VTKVSKSTHADYEAVMAEIRAELGRQQISGNELAKRSGISQSTVSRRLRGSDMSLQEVLALCSALGISLRGVLEDAAKRRLAPVPAMRNEGQVQVAGAGFEPATSGLRVQMSSLRVIDGGCESSGDWTRPVLSVVPDQDLNLRTLGNARGLVGVA
jgi:transcriptional regulator with XRE-family HTH domain